MPETLRERWFYAAKPDSWSKVFMPFWLGVMMGFGGGSITRESMILSIVIGAAFTALDVLFIVFLNDWGDRHVDAIKRRMFPKDCSPKTIPDGILPAHHVLIAGLSAGALAVGVAAIGAIALDRIWLVPAAILLLAIFIAYTLPPIRLNYRGGGELLEMIGIGVALPWFTSYLVSGNVWTAGMALLPGSGALALSSAIASGLSDERSDRAGGKRTMVTMIGNRLARISIEALLGIAALSWIASAALGLPWWIGAIGAASIFVHAIAVHRAGPAAITDAFAAQRTYKAHLHRAIHNSTSVVGLAVMYFHVWLGG